MQIRDQRYYVIHEETQLILLYRGVFLQGLSLRDISILNDYIHLQKVEVPYNELSGKTRERFVSF